MRSRRMLVWVTIPCKSTPYSRSSLWARLLHSTSGKTSACQNWDAFPGQIFAVATVRLVSRAGRHPVGCCPAESISLVSGKGKTIGSPHKASWGFSAEPTPAELLVGKLSAGGECFEPF